MEKNEMGGACSKYGGEERCIRFWWGNLTERDHLEEPGVDGRITLGWIFRKWYVGMDWVDLAQDMDRWRTLVNVVTNLWVPQNAGNFLTSREPVSFSRRTLLHGVLLLLLLSLSPLSPLCRVFIHIFLKQTMSVGNALLQLFCCYCLWCLYL
jgi:hypothetical protein